jgi:histidine ammonia-lyase
MTVLLDSRRDITLEAVRRVAWQGEQVRLSEGALARIETARAAFEELLERDDVSIYGVTTGYGDRANVRLEPEERLEQARQGVARLQVAFGESLPQRVTRAIVLARLASFVEGHSAIRPMLAEAVARMLDADLPPVPAHAHGGAGEIIPLGHLFADLAGIEFAEKESLALVNGSPCAAALVADAALLAVPRLALAEEVFALSAETIRAPHDAYDAALEDLWGDKHEAAALRRFRELLAGGDVARRPYQAPVSYRILPRVLGQARRAAAEAERAAAVSLTSVADNPVFVPPGPGRPLGLILSNGSYHNSQAPAALDGLAGAYADLCQLVERHVDTLLTDPTVGGAIERAPVDMVTAGFAEEARHRAQRTALPPAGSGQNDVGSPSFLAWERAEATATSLVGSLAVLAALASSVLDGAGRTATPALAELLGETRRHVTPASFPSGPGGGIGKLAEAFAARSGAPKD